MRKLIMENLFEKENLNSRYGIYAQTLKDTFSYHQLFRYRIHIFFTQNWIWDWWHQPDFSLFHIFMWQIWNTFVIKINYADFFFSHSLLGRRHILRFSISVTYKLVRIIIIRSYVRFARLKFRSHITLSPRKVWLPKLSIHKYFFLNLMLFYL